MTRLRFACVLLLFAAFASATTLAVLRMIEPPPAPAEVKPGHALAPRLTQHLLLVIVDGLRYDVGTDPLRMPNFARAMQSESSGEIWAGRISMTSSAILALGTGQHGRLEQVVRNLEPRAPPHNSWLQNAQIAGLRLAAVGDPGWFQNYGAHLFEHRDDPAGVAIDVDFNPQTFRGTRELLALSPDFLVAHFVTPDHQGHAYNVISERYSAHIKNFDRELSELLSELPADWTVVVTSDHGASDTGKHGTDVAIQRRSPIYARGPGIRPGVKLSRPIDQLELASTLPTLLGVPAPAHRTGHVLWEWLALPETEQANVACQNAAHVVGYASRIVKPSELEPAQRAARDCASESSPSRRAELAFRAVRISERAVDDSTGLLSAQVLPWLMLVLGLGLALVLALAGARSWRSLPAVVLMLALTIWLVIEVERLPGVWPDSVRAIGFVLGNGALLLLVLRPPFFASLLERLMPHAPALVPATLVVSYPANTRPESYVAMCLCALAAVRSWQLGAGVSQRPSPSRCTWPDIAALALSLLALLPTALKENDGFSRLIASESARPVVYGALLLVWFAWYQRALGIRLATALGLGALAIACFALRSQIGPVLGRSGWLISALVFVALSLQRGESSTARARAVAAGVLAYLWVARDFELLPVLACITVASVVGERLAAWQADRAEPGRLPAAELLVQSLFVFALAYVLRLGIQDGLDFGGMDWQAGAFADPNVSATVVGVGLVYKYALALWLLLTALGGLLSPWHERALLIAISVCLIVRALALALMFLLAGNSYWTALRVLGDLPTALAMTLGALLALSAALLRARRRLEVRAQLVPAAPPRVGETL
jgi:hypothetical protein